MARWARLVPARAVPLVLLALLCAGTSLPASAEEAAEASSGAAAEGSAGSELPDFGSMRIKQLRAILDERGVECKACSEKADLVQRARETYHLPVREPLYTKEGAKVDPDIDSNPEVQRLLREMRGEHAPDPDPAKEAVLQRLRKRGLNFAGGNSMDLEALTKLEESLANMPDLGTGGSGSGEL
mmetsp:Transcript_15915/g.54308  ORF Transcript_15915/g.54308 Transcript_15915/m.54308 type:complete len:184 (+) Transcript_15915:35-586(+)